MVTWVSLGGGSAGIFGPGDLLLDESVFMEVESALGVAFDGSAESFALEFAGNREVGAWVCCGVGVRVGGSGAY